MRVANKLYYAKQVYLRRVFVIVGRDSSVGKMTRYGLDVAGIESGGGGGLDFPHLYRPTLVPTQPSIPWVPVLSQG
jgi:hypothetical protein